MYHPDLQPRILAAIRSEAQRLGHAMTPWHHATYEEVTGSEQLACCTRCGRRLILQRSDLTESAALNEPCDSDTLRAAESQAWLTGDAEKLLLARLTAAARKLVPPDLLPFFNPGDYQPGSRRLESEDGVWSLDWSMRREPDEPISADNPQHPGGYVELIRRVPQKIMHRVRYTGARLNPNFGENPDTWIFEPLEAGTEGVAYPVRPAHSSREPRWRFRRLEGVASFYVSRQDLVFEDSDIDVARSELFYDEEFRRYHDGDSEDDVWMAINQIATSFT